MPDLRQHDAVVETVAKARKEASRRPDIKFPIGSLNQIGRHVYAYSGRVILPTSGADIDMIRFTTTSQYLNVDLTMSANIGGNFTTGFHDLYTIVFNDQEILMFKLESGQEDMPTAFVTPLLIPPFTSVVIKAKSDTNNTSWKASCCIVGEAFDP